MPRESVGQELIILKFNFDMISLHILLLVSLGGKIS